MLMVFKDSSCSEVCEPCSSTDNWHGRGYKFVTRCLCLVDRSSVTDSPENIAALVALTTLVKSVSKSIYQADLPKVGVHSQSKFAAY